MNTAALGIAALVLLAHGIILIGAPLEASTSPLSTPLPGYADMLNITDDQLYSLFASDLKDKNLTKEDAVYMLRRYMKDLVGVRAVNSTEHIYLNQVNFTCVKKDDVTSMAQCYEENNELATCLRGIENLRTASLVKLDSAGSDWTMTPECRKQFSQIWDDLLEMSFDLVWYCFSFHQLDHQDPSQYCAGISYANKSWDLGQPDDAPLSPRLAKLKESWNKWETYRNEWRQIEQRFNKPERALVAQCLYDIRWQSDPSHQCHRIAQVDLPLDAPANIKAMNEIYHKQVMWNHLAECQYDTFQADYLNRDYLLNSCLNITYIYSQGKRIRIDKPMNESYWPFWREVTALTHVYRGFPTSQIEKL